MAKLEDLKVGASVRGLIPGGVAEIVSTKWHGDQALTVYYRGEDGKTRDRIVFRNEENALEVQTSGRVWAFDGDGELLRLVSEAYRLQLAHLFDPYLSIHTSCVEPLPHQITAVYEAMLLRQPLRFLLADDPGAGKTIMTGLLLREQIARGALERCLIVAPGNLVEQWQDELAEKFDLHFEILTRDKIEAAHAGNCFGQNNLLIARLDMLSRNEDLQDRLRAAPHWDMIVCDEAHKMAATFFGNEIKYTKRYLFGRLLGQKCANFLLLTATPHNGKEADFQLFLALLDGDRFEGKFRDGVHKVDPSDMMRRLVKEELLKFDGTPLFPERRAYTATYKLSDEEAALYADVTNYVREEMNRADRIQQDEKRRINITFALMILQRRLASSSAAIYSSLVRRRERLEKRLREEQLLLRGESKRVPEKEGPPVSNNEFWDDMDELPENELEEAEQVVVDRATASETIQELKAEIETLKVLEQKGRAVLNSGKDAKWAQLNSILDDPLMLDEAGNRRKLIIFSEPRDTVEYLAERIRVRLGKREAVVVITGLVGREERRKVIEAFNHDKNVLVLVANDAAGEGVNLQRAHLMVNYDLPWNPNKLEQRFGRIHRIGQQEVCHLWNLVANETREGEVYEQLLRKLDIEREALGGRVYDVLGSLFEERPLRDLLIEAIRYGDQPEVKARLHQALDNAVDREHITRIYEERALTRDTMDSSVVARVREEMERAQARRLQPHFVQSFFEAAFTKLGGALHSREPGRYEITRVPGPIRERDRLSGTGQVVLPRYERICFEKDRIHAGTPAAFVCPGHPLFDATVSLILDRYGDLLKRGAILIDEEDPGEDAHALFYLEHAVQDGRLDRHGNQTHVSQRMQFVEIAASGEIHDAGPAPYLDYRPATQADRTLLAPLLDEEWLQRDMESEIVSYAIQHIVPAHVDEVRALRLPLIDKTEQAVNTRLQQEINYWDRRAEELKLREKAGRTPRLNSGMARQRAEDLADRLQRRQAELARQREISALTPLVRGGALVVPSGLLRSLRGESPEVDAPPDAESRKKIELLAMQAVIDAERALGRVARDVSAQRHIGYDIESKDPRTGHLFFIEVKGRWHGKDSVTLTKNEVLCSRNEPERFRLAIVLVDEGGPQAPRYLVNHTFGELDFAEEKRTLTLDKLLALATDPM